IATMVDITPPVYVERFSGVDGATIKAFDRNGRGTVREISVMQIGSLSRENRARESFVQVANRARTDRITSPLSGMKETDFERHIRVVIEVTRGTVHLCLSLSARHQKDEKTRNNKNRRVSELALESHDFSFQETS